MSTLESQLAAEKARADANEKLNQELSELVGEEAAKHTDAYRKWRQHMIRVDDTIADLQRQANALRSSLTALYTACRDRLPADQLAKISDEMSNAKARL